MPHAVFWESIKPVGGPARLHPDFLELLETCQNER
jgi:hypothetical protein